MTNLVEITVRTKDDASSAFKTIEKTASDSGSASGKGFSDNFAKSTGGGLLGGLFGKGGGSAVEDAQKQGQNVGMGLGRGILQKFNSTLGSGLLSGLFGTSGGSKLFGNAGNTVVQDATKQGENIAQGLGKGLNQGFANAANIVGGTLSSLFGGDPGGSEAAAEDEGGQIASSLTRGMTNGFANLSSNVGGMLSGLFGGGSGGRVDNEAEDTGQDVGRSFTKGLTDGFARAGSSVSGVLGKLFGGSGDDLAADGAKDGAEAGKGILSGISSSISDGVTGIGKTVGGLVPVMGDSMSEGLAESPWLSVGVLAAVAAAAPVVGVALSGMLVTALGGGLAAMAIMGAQKAPAVEKAFSGLKTSANNDLTQIGTPFQGVMQTIYNTASGVLGKLTPVFKTAATTIAQPFQQFATTLEKSFGDPAVKNSIEAVAGAFGKILNVLTPELPGMVDKIADGITNVADAIGKNPQAFANFIGFLVDIVAYSLDAIAWLTNMGTDFKNFLGDLPGWTHTAVTAVEQAWAALEVVSLEVARDISMGFLDMVGDVLDAAATAFGWVPGLGGKLKGAATAFDGFKTGVSNDFNTLVGNAQAWGRSLDGASASSAQASKSIQGDFRNQANASSTASVALSDLTSAIKQNGVDSSQAQAARGQLIKDLESAGLNSKQAQGDVDNYTTAVKNNGVDSSQAKAARQQLVTDILDASKNAAQGKSDLTNYTNAVKTNGANSDSARSARQRLITDLENSGLNAKTATGLVNGLSTAVKNVPSGKTVTLTARAVGTGKVVYKESFPGGSLQGSLLYGAAGGVVPGEAGPSGVRRVPGYAPGQDSQWARVSPGEAILVPEAARALGYGNILGWNRQFGRGRKSTGLAYAAGGIAGNPGLLSDQMGSVSDGYMQRVTSAAGAKMYALLKEKVNAAKSLQAFVNVSGSGVTRWTSTVLEALAMEGLSAGLAPNVLYQMQTESGGNPNAINLTDSNAAAGDPSRGLMQTIMSTFQAYHWPGTSNDIYNPLANIAAAINYARHVYGPNLANQYGGIGSGHGYGSGGATSAGWAMVGERGRELVKLPGGATVYPAGATSAMASGGSAPTSVQLEITSGGQSAFEQFMLTSIRSWVRVKGGGDVQRAFGKS